MTYLTLAKQAEARLRAGATDPVESAAPVPAADSVALLLDTRLDALAAPLAVDSAIVGRIYLVRDEDQGKAVRATGGVPYTPAEVAILRELWAAVPREEWGERLRAIHVVKQKFEGGLC